MAYNPRTAMEKIYEFKGIWEDADKVGDVKKKNEAAKKAQQYYSELKDNGYGTVANNLQKSNYSQASKYLNNYKIKSGNVPFRNYMYENLKPYGVTNDQVDKLTGFDPDTGEVTFAGRNIGKGEGIADNRTYFKAQDLDNIIKDFTSNQGLSRSPEVLEGVHNEKINRELDDYQSGVSANEDFYKKKYEETDDYNKNFNPYNSEIGKAIMEDYKHMGEVAGGDAIADGAGSNGGNIDSFAAANAARQQLDFTNAGKQMVLADFNSRVGRAKEMLSDLGVQLRGFNSDKLSGIQTRQYESQRLTENRYNNDKLKEEGRQFDESIKQADRALSADNQNALAQIEAQNRGAIEQIEAQTQGEKEIIQENAKYSTDGGDNYAAYNAFLSAWPTYEKEKREFVDKFIKPIYEGKEIVTPESLKTLILSNSEKYNIDVDDAARICRAFDVSTAWLEDYRDRTNGDGDVTSYDDSSRKGQYGGMVLK